MSLIIFLLCQFTISWNYYLFPIILIYVFHNINDACFCNTSYNYSFLYNINFLNPYEIVKVTYNLKRIKYNQETSKIENSDNQNKKCRISILTTKKNDAHLFKNMSIVKVIYTLGIFTEKISLQGFYRKSHMCLGENILNSN